MWPRLRTKKMRSVQSVRLLLFLLVPCSTSECNWIVSSIHTKQYKAWTLAFTDSIFFLSFFFSSPLCQWKYCEQFDVHFSSSSSPPHRLLFSFSLYNSTRRSLIISCFTRHCILSCFFFFSLLVWVSLVTRHHFDLNYNRFSSLFLFSFAFSALGIFIFKGILFTMFLAYSLRGEDLKWNRSPSLPLQKYGSGSIQRKTSDRASNYSRSLRSPASLSVSGSGASYSHKARPMPPIPREKQSLSEVSETSLHPT